MPNSCSGSAFEDRHKTVTCQPSVHVSIRRGKATYCRKTEGNRKDARTQQKRQNKTNKNLTRVHPALNMNRLAWSSLLNLAWGTSGDIGLSLIDHLQSWTTPPPRVWVSEQMRHISGAREAGGGAGSRRDYLLAVRDTYAVTCKPRDWTVQVYA